MRAEPITTPVKTGWKCIDDRTLTADMLRRDKEAQEAFINALTPAELDALPFDWGFWARDDQLPPRDWITGEKYIWCLRCGRGWGKTRTAGQAIIEAVRTGKYKHLSLCGATAEEVRDIMINGESGLARYCPPDLGMVYKPSIKKVFFSNGAIISAAMDGSSLIRSEFAFANSCVTEVHGCTSVTRSRRNQEGRSLIGSGAMKYINGNIRKKHLITFFLVYA